ncbi:PDDEXK nuclease domain-containing protein [Microcoleus sp. F4-D5]|uniref:PDDEXK nuclease domain-containing protein n=1 Tax=Microcoleus sp. F4-D5 TaxID=2818760 RepID=UPI002FD0837E
MLVHQIESGLYRRQGKADTNFSGTLPNPQSELAQQLLKDPCNFDFISLGKEAQERELEKALIDRIRAFLLELGMGFAFVGRQSIARF